MQHFSNFLVPEERKNFEEFKQKKILCEMRKEIEDIILNCNENECLDLVMFKNKHNVKDMKFVLEMCQILKTELEKLGWNTILTYGNTAFYIYYDKKPMCLSWMDEK